MADKDKGHPTAMNRRGFMVSFAMAGAVVGVGAIAAVPLPNASRQSAMNEPGGDKFSAEPQDEQPKRYVFASDPRAGQAGFSVMPG